MSKLCPNCGKELNDTDVFCSKCATQVGDLATNPVKTNNEKKYIPNQVKKPNFNYDEEVMEVKQEKEETLIKEEVKENVQVEEKHDLIEKKKSKTSELSIVGFILSVGLIFSILFGVIDSSFVFVILFFIALYISVKSLFLAFKRKEKGLFLSTISVILCFLVFIRFLYYCFFYTPSDKIKPNYKCADAICPSDCVKGEDCTCTYQNNDGEFEKIVCHW